MSKARVGYMCMIAYDWELGEAPGGSTIYYSVEDLKKNHKCADECGIVKVEIKQTEVIQRCTMVGE